MLLGTGPWIHADELFILCDVAVVIIMIAANPNPFFFFFIFIDPRLAPGKREDTGVYETRASRHHVC